jgi:SAM-dependent methyltransferase
MNDVLGQALLDYHKGNYTEDIITATNISDEDTLPLPYLFRNLAEMPFIEKTALKHCKGHVLDVGCGAGSHALILQNNGLPVTAMDISKGACQVATERGVKKVLFGNVLELRDLQFDTLLLLMNGTGIFGKLANVSDALIHLKTLLKPGGQLLIDSSDLIYMYEEEEEEEEDNDVPENTNGIDLSAKATNKRMVQPKGVWVPGAYYYGELSFTMTYKKIQTAPFSWLYLDETLFETAAISNGFTFEILKRGENYDYLAKLTIADCTL